MTPERLEELKKYCELWDGKDYKGFEIKEISWLIAEVERLRDEIGYCDHEWRMSYRQHAPDGTIIHQIDKCDKCDKRKEHR
jgi:hypothetical protein